MTARDRSSQGSRLKVGMFLMPISRPDRPLADAIDWYLEVIRKAEEFGFSEMWIGEHMTSRWERITSPQQIIARALADTRRMMLGTGVEILYQQHPVTLALALAQLDHMARGRLLFGFGAGATLTDLQLYGVDAPTSQEMAREALQIILNCWQEGGPKPFSGKYWTVGQVDPALVYKQAETHGWHLRPYGAAEPRIAFAGFGGKSPSLRTAGAGGYIPMSLNISKEYLAAHWESVQEGAASTGQQADRRRWRQAKEIYVADTKQEARRAVVKGFMSRYWNDYAVRSYFAQKPELLNMFRKPGDSPTTPVTPEYLIDSGIWLVGDPSSIAEQIREQFRVSGGFGTLLQIGMDYADEPEGWLRSMQLLTQEVMPKLADLVIEA